MFASKKPTELFRHSGLYIGSAGEKGRGVFCREDLKAGAVIEIAPVLIFNEAETQLLAKSRMRDYIFPPRPEASDLCKRDRIGDHTKATFIVMGVLTHCNHRRAPNARIGFTDGYHTGYYTLTAWHDIVKDTEICIDFGQQWFSGRAYPDAFTRGEGDCT